LITFSTIAATMARTLARNGRSPGLVTSPALPGSQMADR
jgi:hypothetical protein